MKIDTIKNAADLKATAARTIARENAKREVLEQIAIRARRFNLLDLPGPNGKALRDGPGAEVLTMAAAMMKKARELERIGKAMIRKKTA